MVQIGDTIVSFDLFQEYFFCNFSHCKGICCVEGEAGAPVAFDEIEKLEEALPVIEKEMRGEALAVVKEQGVVYNDPDGDLVTSIVNGKDCVFATCDSLQRMCSYYESKYALYKTEYENLKAFQESELEDDPPDVVRVFFQGVLAGILLTIATIIFIKLKTKLL